ncbi:MAG: hypothetical protein WCW17_01365 [Patescibacteria group bacterium]|jgi:hypothetical protein
MEKIDKIINKRLKQGDFKKPMKAAMVCMIVQKIIPECRVVSFDGGLLRLWALDYPTANTIIMNQINLIKEINKELKFERVKGIRVRVKNYS